MLLVGRKGVGKSHIAESLGQRACRAGYQVIYVSANDMLRQLRSARADNSIDRKMYRLTSPEVEEVARSYVDPSEFWNAGWEGACTTSGCRRMELGASRSRT